MAVLTYPYILERAKGGYGVVFPDLDGCTSFGASYEEAAANAAEALTMHLEGMVEDKQPLPEPTPAAELLDGSPVPLAVGIARAAAPDRSERVNVYLSSSLLERVDRYSQASGYNRSTFFQVAARELLEREKRTTRP